MLGTVDSASVSQVVELLYFAKPTESYPWAWMTSLEVTSLLIRAPHLKMMPGPGKAGAATGAYGMLTRQLAGILGQEPPNIEGSHAALASTRRWARRNAPKIAGLYRELRSDNRNFGTWLDWSVRTAWPERASRLGGLFDDALTPEIAAILGFSQEYMNVLRRAGTDPVTVQAFARWQPDSDTFRHLVDAYVVSALLRGRFHDYVARRQASQVVHHPFRQSVLSRLHGSRTEYELENTERYLANIILAAAFAEKRHEARITVWAQNVLLARQGLMDESIALFPKRSDVVGLETAIRSAKQIGIRTHPKWLEHALDASVALGVGALSSFYLEGWGSFAAGMVGYGTSLALAGGRRGVQQLAARSRRLRDLAAAGPGRIQPRWTSEAGGP